MIDAQWAANFGLILLQYCIPECLWRQTADSNVKLNSEVGMRCFFFFFAQSMTKIWYPQIVMITAHHAVAPALFLVESYYTFILSSILLQYIYKTRQ